MPLLGADGAALPILEAAAPPGALALGAAVPADASQQATFTLDLLATALAGATMHIHRGRLLLLPLFGVGLGTDASAATVPVDLTGWWSANPPAASQAQAAEDGQARRLGGGAGPLNCLEFAVPWQRQLWALRLQVQVSTPQAAGLGWTGFPAHHLVYLELAGPAGASGSGADIAHGLRFSNDWLSLAPSLRSANVVPRSQRGNAVQSLDVLLRLGFRAAGLDVKIDAPAGTVILGLQPPAGPVAYADELAVVQAVTLPVDVGGSSFGGGSATLRVPSPALWPNAVYVYSLRVRNPAVLATDFEWTVTVESANGFVDDGGAPPPALLRIQAEKEVALADGAFTVVPELEGCSVVPSTMLLGAENEVTNK